MLLESHVAFARAAVAEAKLGLASKEVRERKSAPQYLVTMVAALERLVVDDIEPKYVRMYAWWKLSKSTRP